MSTITRITVAEYDRMIESDVFADRHDQKLELINGRIIEMTPRGPLHESAVDWLNEWSVRNVNLRKVRVRVHNTVGIPELDSVPLPDIVWVRRKSYRTQRPMIDDVLLIIEVSHSTLLYDRGEKLELNAQAGVREYWIANIQDLVVEVYRNPSGQSYRHCEHFSVGQTVSPLYQPTLKLCVRELMTA
jgi:Uma2 family endonuclease